MYYEINQLSNTPAARFLYTSNTRIGWSKSVKAQLSVRAHIFVCSTVLAALWLTMGRSSVQTSTRIPKFQKLINEWKLKTRSKNISRDSPRYFQFCWKTMNKCYIFCNDNRPLTLQERRNVVSISQVRTTAMLRGIILREYALYREWSY